MDDSRLAFADQADAAALALPAAVVQRLFSGALPFG
jgi:hypothetical protein